MTRENETCARCGAALMADGSCPRCLLEIGLDSIDTAWGSEAGSVELDPNCIPGFELIEKLGRGGMGVVYRARQKELDRMVAVKVLSPNVRHLPDFAERFRREARAMASLNHPGVVAVHDFGEAGGLYYLVMELVEGANLRELMLSGKVSSTQALEIVRQVCAALHFAHERGVVHRDIKPENVLVDVEGRVRITDFGLARLLGGPESGRLTQSRHVMGTPLYMAPEQVSEPLHVDHRADIYSLGVVLYELLTGDLPVGRFEMPSEHENVDRRLDDIVLRTLERRPEKRYQRVSEVSQELDSLGAAKLAGEEASEAAAPAAPVAADDTGEDPDGDVSRDPREGIPSWITWIEVPVAILMFIGCVLRWGEPIHYMQVSSARDWSILAAISALLVPGVWLSSRQKPRREAMGAACLIAGLVGLGACTFVTRGFGLIGMDQLRAGFWITLLTSTCLVLLGVKRLRVVTEAARLIGRFGGLPPELLVRVRAAVPWIALLGVPALVMRFAAPAPYHGTVYWDDTSIFRMWSGPAILIGVSSAALALLLCVTRRARILFWDGLFCVLVGGMNAVVALDGAFQPELIDARPAAWTGLFTGVLLVLAGVAMIADRLAAHARRVGPRKG